MSTQRRTLELTADQWAEVEAALLAAARANRERADRLPRPGRTFRAAHDRADTLMLAARQIQAAGAAGHDGGPVGTCRHTVR